MFCPLTERSQYRSQRQFSLVIVNPLALVERNVGLPCLTFYALVSRFHIVNPGLALLFAYT